MSVATDWWDDDTGTDNISSDNNDSGKTVDHFGNMWQRHQCVRWWKFGKLVVIFLAQPQSRQSPKLFLQSSKLGLSYRRTRRRVCPSPLVRGVGVHSLAERGWGSPNSDEETYGRRVFVGPKKKTIVSVLVFNPLCIQWSLHECRDAKTIPCLIWFGRLFCSLICSSLSWFKILNILDVQVLEGDDFRKTYTVVLPNKPTLLAVECVDSGIAIKCASKHGIYFWILMKITALRNRCNSLTFRTNWRNYSLNRQWGRHG